MRVKNADSKVRSYFVYNFEDTSQSVGLATGAIKPGDTWDWNPPQNGSGFYTVLMKRDAGGGSVMAGGSGSKEAMFTFTGHTLGVA